MSLWPYQSLTCLLYRFLSSPDTFSSADESELNWIGNELIEVCQDPVTGQQMWECTQCDFSCSSRAIIKEHVERHIAGELDSEDTNSQDSVSQQGSEQSSNWYQPTY
jgi:hypothetical protein